MLTPSALELARLRSVAAELEESLAAEAFLVGDATAQHEAFRDSGRAESELARSLVLRAVERGASLAGVHTEKATGGGLDVVSRDEGVVRRYRVKKAARLADGSHSVVCGAGSSLLRSDPGGIWPEERWLFGYSLGDDSTVSEVFVASIIDFVPAESGPLRLVLGPEYPLLARSRMEVASFAHPEEDLEAAFGETAED